VQCVTPTHSGNSERGAAKLTKAQVQSKVHLVPVLRFEQQQQLTSFAGAVLYQVLFRALALKARLRSCFGDGSEGRAYGAHLVVLSLVLHLLLGFRQLRDRDYYYNDPLVARVLGLRSLPDVSTVSRTLSDCTGRDVERGRRLLRTLVLKRLQAEGLQRITLDYDGSVLTTRRHAEGTAVGFNRKRKGARSYYPLFCTIAQRGQFLDFHHRPGNVHDSNGALQFMRGCVDEVHQYLPGAQLESRVDGAFFDERILSFYARRRVDFSASLPFERFPQLKRTIERRRRWHPINETWAYFELSWKPKRWRVGFRVLVFRKRSLLQRKAPLQLDLFEPRDQQFEYKAVVSNKRGHARSVLRFHNGRGSQEGVLGEAKQYAQLEFIPCRRLVPNQLVQLASLLAHNLGRELQMAAKPRVRGTTAKRRALWDFETLGTLRQRLVQRAGRLTNPAGELTLTVGANEATCRELTDYLAALQQAA
jgi:hypothetical protein